MIIVQKGGVQVNDSDMPSITVRWNEKLQAVEQIWNGHFSREEHNQAAEDVLALLKEKRATRLFSDCTKMMVVHPDDQKWIEVDWLPRMVSAGLEKIALVLPAGSVAQLSVGKMERSIDPQDVGFERYMTEDAKQAIAWLVE